MGWEDSLKILDHSFRKVFPVYFLLGAGNVDQLKAGKNQDLIILRGPF